MLYGDGSELDDGALAALGEVKRFMDERLVAFGWRPVLVPELLRDERRVWRGEFAHESRFVVDMLV